MIRKLILPAIVVALLGGCVTGYSYRQGSGDYYYGAPSVEYRYYPTYPYGAYGYYGPYRYADPYAYRGYPYRYYGGYGYPYGGYPYYYRRQVQQVPRSDPTPDSSTSPWRRLDDMRRRQPDGTASPPSTSEPPSSTSAPPPSASALPPAAPTRTPRSAVGGMIRRAREREPSREDGQ